METNADHCKAGGRNYPIRPIARAIALQRNELVTLLPLQGECIHVVIPQGVALAKSFWAFSPFQPYSSIFFMFISIDIFCSVRVCLEDGTERSESNPGRSLGITNMK